MHAFLKTGKLGAGAGGPSSGEGSKKAAVKKALVPWVEKYRPKTVEEVAYQEEVVAVLRKTLEGADLPNLLFYGPPGTGKTSTILAAARQLFGDMFRQRVLELNASDSTTVSSTRPDGRPCPSFKIVILDEADSMTRPAQAALRRTMEVQSRSTRFCLVCNYVTRIIEPLTSRCSKFRFRPLAQDVLEDRLTTICRSEGVKFEEGVVAAVVETSGGDLRRAITSLQSSARLRGGDVVRVSDVLDVTGVVPDELITHLLDACSANSYEGVKERLSVLLAEGHAASQVMSQLHDVVLANPHLSDLSKAAICEKLAVCEHRLLGGGDEFLQLLDLSCTAMQHLGRGA
ncbi:hypothetical protein O3P69_019558 [Scylla paramamosain]|uniref:AAA+ ATPase domain-containing protein n=1 Tax=Scylla paramamosain TaxID=85552 RepID=A0AAW0T090_SCYPA